jgi:hypothetical protein
MEVTIMPSLLWLALLLGFLTGVAAAALLLRSRLIETLYGPLSLTTVVVAGAVGALRRLRRLSLGADARGAAPPHQPSRGGGDRPHLPGPGAPAPEAHDRARDERWPLMVRLEAPGVIGPGELRQSLYQGRVDLRLQPVVSLAQPQAALYRALPRLRTVDDRPLEPGSWHGTAARAGLLGTIDRLLLLRCVDALRTARVGRESTVLCAIAAASLTDPGFIAELEQQLGDDRALAESLVLALDHALRDGPSVVAATGLRARGVRFCLRRLGPPRLDPPALRAAGFAFVLLEAERFALAPAGALDPALRALQTVLGADGPCLLVPRAGAACMTLPGPLGAGRDTPDLARPSAA